QRFVLRDRIRRSRRKQAQVRKSPHKLGGVASRAPREKTGWFQKGTTTPRALALGTPPNLGGELGSVLVPAGQTPSDIGTEFLHYVRKHIGSDHECQLFAAVVP